MPGLFKPDKLKTLFSNQKPGIVLGLLCLVLIGDCAYLNAVKAGKEENLEQVNQQLEHYQEALAVPKNRLQEKFPDEALQQTPYGRFLHDALPRLKQDIRSLNWQEIALLDVIEDPLDNPSGKPAPKAAHHKKPLVRHHKILEVIGAIDPVQDPMPYQKLNSALLRLQQDTGCVLALDHATEDAENASRSGGASKKALQMSFQLRIQPDQAASCFTQYNHEQNHAI